MENRIFLCPCKVWENLRDHSKQVLILILAVVGVFILDWWVKQKILEGFRYEGSVISIVYVLNKGVAFSMFAFLGEWLKWIQLGIVIVCFYVFLASRDLLLRYALPCGLILGAGIGNLYDRFVYGGVVDYIFWHYQFEFAVFNLADVVINLSVGFLLLLFFFGKKHA